MGQPNSVSWYEECYGKYRVGKSYQRSIAHLRMTDARREEIQNKHWWKKKKAKKHYRNNWYYGGRSRQYCLKTSQRRLRRWFKARVHHEDYDSIPTEYPKSLFYDPWSWS